MASIQGAFDQHGAAINKIMEIVMDLDRRMNMLEDIKRPVLKGQDKVKTGKGKDMFIKMKNGKKEGLK